MGEIMEEEFTIFQGISLIIVLIICVIVNVFISTIIGKVVWTGFAGFIGFLNWKYKW